MFDRSQLIAKAEAARDKKAAIGPDIDLAQYATQAEGHNYLEQNDLMMLPSADQDRMVMAGLDLGGHDRCGTYILKDTSVVHCSTQAEGIEVVSLRQALDQYDWLRDYYFKLVAVDTDKYTASAALDLHDGYLIRALPGAKVVYPIQACLYMDRDGLQQNVHNILIAEEGAELHVISGCATSPHLQRGLHVGVTEYYVKKNASLSFTMIHNWAENVVVRPRSAAHVAEGGQFVSNYVSMKPVSDLQSYPTVTLDGPDAVARQYSILVGHPNTNIDLGGRTIMNHPGCKAEIVSRAITGGGTIMARGHMVGNAPGIKAHLECRGLILEGGSLLAVPQLDGHAEGVEMSHEAAVGKIAQDEINYLMARGLNEEDATSTIVRGFLNVDIPGLPQALKNEIDKAIAATDEDSM